MATNLQGSSHRPRAVGFRLRNRKEYIYENGKTKYVSVEDACLVDNGLNIGDVWPEEGSNT
jgi:hypothetical protein